MTDDLRNH